jgi:hypothetical protein
VSIELADNGPGLRVTLRFFAPDQQTHAGDRLAKHQTQGKLWPVSNPAPAVSRNTMPTASS